MRDRFFVKCEDKSNTEGLDFFFRPRSVAVIGASERRGSWGYNITRNFVQQGFKGEFYPINPKAEEIFGFKAYPRLQDIPGEVDLVAMVLPPEKVIDQMETCVSKGVKCVVLVSSGFGEVSAKGKRVERLVRAVAKKGGIRLLGPNCSGFYDLPHGLNVSGLDGLFLRDLPISFVSQSGYSADSLAMEGSFRGVGFNRYVHTGNEGDLTCTDFLEYFGRDIRTKVILLYMEGLKDGRRFIEVAREVTRKKPIIAFKAGTTPMGARAMLSHTGSMAGADPIFEMVFKKTGIVRVEKLEDILSVGNAFLHFPPLKGNRISIFTMGGGWGIALADALIRKGLRVPESPPSLINNLAQLGDIPPWASLKNPVDIGAAFGEISDPSKTLKMVDIVLSHEEIDGLVIYGLGRLGMMGRKRPEYDSLVTAEVELLDQMCQTAKRHAKPLLICSLFGAESLTFKALMKRGLVFYRDIEEVATVLAALHSYYRFLNGGASVGKTQQNELQDNIGDPKAFADIMS